MNRFKVRSWTDDQRILALVAAFWGIQSITLFINTFVNLIIPNTPFDTMLCYGLYALVILQAMPVIIRRLKAGDLLLFLMVFIVFFLSMLLFQRNQAIILGILPNFILVVFPMFFVGRAFTNLAGAEKVLGLMSKVVVSISLGCHILNLLAGNPIGKDMSFSYMVLPSVLLCVYNFTMQHNVKNALFSGIGLLLLLMGGTRGPLVCLAVFIMFCLYKKKMLFKVLLVLIPLVVLFVFLPYEQILRAPLKAISDLLAQWNIQNVFIYRFLNGTLFNSSGRNVIADLVIEGIRESPILGNGLAGDRFMTIELSSNGITGTYAHNYFLELWCQFGIFMGTALALVPLILLWKAWQKNRDYPFVLALFAILFCCTFIRLMVSNSYLNDPWFFFMLGICASALTRNQSNRTVFKKLRLCKS